MYLSISRTQQHEQHSCITPHEYYSVTARKQQTCSWCPQFLLSCVFIEADVSAFVSQMKNIKLPVHYGIKCFHCVQVCVAVVTSHCKNSPHQCCDADSTPWGRKLCDILPLVAAWVKAFHRAQRRVVIEATCRGSHHALVFSHLVVVIFWVCIIGAFSIEWASV